MYTVTPALRSSLHQHNHGQHEQGTWGKEHGIRIREARDPTRRDPRDRAEHLMA
ncbi:hypothetical protein QIS74_03282 [Colletotrichum tabaci]|uniref:Uncharacterized protein n=1 Tax=Colletotrichum tabaci TaxID=1209068 RepID=A0AAV9TNA4_9PEZI